MLLDSDAVLTININAYRKDQDVISTQNNINISWEMIPTIIIIIIQLLTLLLYMG